jgi:glycerol-3-phosphate responsive antiterminator
MMEFIINIILWTFSFYGIIEFIKKIIDISIHTNLQSEGIYMIIAVKNQEQEIEGILRALIFKILYGKEKTIKRLFIVDLNSTDKTKELISKLEMEYNFIKILEWKECKEIIDAVNSIQ